MSVSYQAVGWNPQKKRIDLALGVGVVLYLAAFLGVGAALFPRATIETLLIRALGTGAFLLLHVILAIGPLARLDRRFLPLLYNRRHLGVTMFLLAAGHGGFSIVQFHVLGELHPLVSVLSSPGSWQGVSDVPFQPLGLFALGILFLMAATSHDFWLAQLTPPVWKALHMGVYVAWGLVVAHVALGVLQAETDPLYGIVLGLGVVTVTGLHGVAGWRERAGDADGGGPEPVDVCAVDEIPEGRARVACLSGERVAVFRWEGNVAAVSNVCQHQNGPLGEGRILDGCITCPWHGYQYDPATGESPPPFTEKVPTFRVTLRDGRVLVDPRPHPPGLPCEPARIPGAAVRAEEAGDGA